MKSYLFTLLVLITSLSLHAQKLTVEQMTALPMDLSASQYERKDLAGKSCALVKVQLAATDVLFEGNVIGKPEYKTGEYWVYMTEGSYMLSIKHQSFVPLSVNFRDYGISGVSSKTTYKLTLLTPSPDIVVMPTIESFTVKGVPFSMVHVEGGTFLMGSDDAEDAEKPLHPVTLSAYSIGQAEVTQELWETVMGKNPSVFKGAKRPVENVGWEDCQKFIQKLNKMTGRQFRLPTEAEWEYAARGGNRSQNYKYSGSNIIDDVAWYHENSGHETITLGELLSGDRSYDDNARQTHDIGTKQANELGLYDMSGNVREWCQDWSGSYNNSAQTNPTGPSSGRSHVFRGGSWDSADSRCRPTERYMSTKYKYALSYRYYDLGFRLAL